MPRITIKAVHTDGKPRRWTLSERITTDNLASDHYATQLIDRLRWATADAEALESEHASGTSLTAPTPSRTNDNTAAFSGAVPISRKPGMPSRAPVA